MNTMVKLTNLIIMNIITVTNVMIIVQTLIIINFIFRKG